MNDLIGRLSIFGFFFVLLMIYCVNIQWRRWKYRNIARELGAQFQSQGPFKSGKIAGPASQRSYTIENRDGARGSGVWTIIEMQCTNKGIPLRIEGHFFKNFPDWRYASTIGEQTEHVFVANITVQGAGIPLGDKYKIQVQSLFQDLALRNDAFLQKGILRVEDGRVSFMTHGIVNRLDSVRQMLSVLTGVAECIESAPVV
jgi:hypothetical protein